MRHIRRFEAMKKVNDFDYLCVPHQQLSNYLHTRMFGLQETLSKDILTGDKIEQDHHLTVIFGILYTSENFELIQDQFSLSPHGPIRMKIGNIAKFEAKEYDVLHYEIESSELEQVFIKANAVIEMTPESYQNKEFKPHMTIAYVKKGAGDFLLGKNALLDYDFIVDELQFTDIYDRKKRIIL